jgi:hypothetical protein
VNPGADDAPYPAIAALLRGRRAIALGSAVAAGLLTGWLAWRLQWPELYALGLLAGLALYFVMRVAIEVVALVAETLMPR